MHYKHKNTVVNLAHQARAEMVGPKADIDYNSEWGMSTLSSFYVVYLRTFIYKWTQTKLGSVCRADQMQFKDPILRSVAKFNIELEQFCWSLTAALACILSIALFE